jgi:hypothetical protein
MSSCRTVSTHVKVSRLSSVVWDIVSSRDLLSEVFSDVTVSLDWETEARRRVGATGGWDPDSSPSSGRRTFGGGVGAMPGYRSRSM